MSTTEFTTAEGLRLLLVRLHYSGQGTWKNDAEAAELLAFASNKYGALARKYGLEPQDAAVAAFEAMRTRAVRAAADPWAVITRAVQVTLIYDSRAEGLLCSTHQARRSTVSANHDAERFSDRDSELAAFHPAFQVQPEQDVRDWDEIETHADEEPTNAWMAADQAVQILTELGWPTVAARGCIEYICARLIRTGSREGAFESLRRDHQVEAFLDLDHETWMTVLRAVLGNQQSDFLHTSVGRGVLLLLMMGYLPSEIATDVGLSRAIESTAPTRGGTSRV
ncbi:hypothetical protein NPS01_37720 [Nocardioides psychrotolerans]|uniref:Uncharacterized protein n=1 Tax=Nocardioides psychrotolerans TaxID=1005945 RepID=A0A1I3QJZ4_9ACTN|nr:hypothetical protein [Nocardioides psychrotolerans]GEP40109.1 hypothetical protein NPS01_37720 [Nocardioides psychrotolerans]SFJ33611.1 hypothetical protein SAMN05216561_12547 [Nocardioides psychrotolerans]